MYLYIDMKVENFILVLAQSELMSDHEPDDSDTEFIDIDISGSYGWVLYYIDMVENFILVLAQSELMSYHEPDDSDT
ncbi:hypothetical protein HanIR_Chr15g0769641 [Helianthus annuus]|nr:hypothetical protein HanIR_Chr15g0769641 [Helianthus annuus]